MKTSDFGYELPKELIAQSPMEQRDQCRMLVLHKEDGSLEDRRFFEIEQYLEEGDLLIANETRVLPARLLGKKRGSGANAEVFLLTPLGDGQKWEALVKPGRRLKPQENGSNPIVDFCDTTGKVALSAEICDWGSKEQPGMRIVRLFCEGKDSDEALAVSDAMHIVGNTPLPPYIHGYTGDMEMYQTVYAARESSAAAPTAGLHFTSELIERLKNKGVQFQTVELEVGIDTFRPVDEKNPRDHKMHTEMYSISDDVIKAIEQTKNNGHRVVAVGTTSVRTLESAWNEKLSSLEPCVRKPTALFILPGYEFKVVDAMITNFHVPESTLMMLVSSFASMEKIKTAYQHAVQEKYRFLSFGDAMFIC